MKIFSFKHGFRLPRLGLAKDKTTDRSSTHFKHVGAVETADSIAQVLPEDILMAIFEILSPIDTRQTLVNCSLVCRSWNQSSSRILFCDVRATVAPPRQGHKTLSAILRFKSQHRPAASTETTPSPRGKLLSTTVLCTPRFVANLRILRLHAELLDFMVLRSIVFQLVHLRDLCLNVNRFIPLARGQWQSFSSSYWWTPPSRRSIRSILLCSAKTPIEAHSRSRNPTPQLLDILLWFDRCDILDIQVEGSPAHLIHQLKTDRETDVEGLRLHTKVIVCKLSLHTADVSVCLDRSFVEDVFDFQLLNSLFVWLRPSEHTLLRACLDAHGQALQKLMILLVCGVPPDDPTSENWTDWTDDEICALQRAANDPIAMTCPRLESVHFILRADLNYPACTALCQQLWQTYVNSFMSAPALNSLRFLFIMTHDWFNMSRSAAGDTELAHQAVLAFVTGLNWSLLDSPMNAEPQLTAPHLELIQVAVTEYVTGLCEWTSPPLEGLGALEDIIRSKVSTRTRRILSIVHTPFSGLDFGTHGFFTA